MKFLTRKIILPWFKKRLPRLSSEEQVVLDTGELWYEKEFFSGKPDWSKLFSLSKPELSQVERDFLCHEVEELCSLVNDWEVSHVNNDLPKVAWDYIKKCGFWALTIPKEFGGHGFSAIAHSTIVSKLATRSMALAYTVMVPNSLGVSTFLLEFGTKEQQEKYLPPLSSGQEISCFALTTPMSGSDATSISDTGIVCRDKFDGQEVIGIRLNFNKRYITLAPVATLIGLAFQLKDPDHLIGDKADYGISLALLPAHLVGIDHGHRHCPFNLGFMNGPIRGQNIFIPLNYLIGGLEWAGRGWEMMVTCLSVGRGLSLPAVSSGIAQVATRTSSAYATIREQFNVSIGSFEGIQASLARVVALTYCCEAVRLFTGLAVAEGKRPSVASAIAKYHLTEITQRVILDAMDIHGGKAVQLGPKNILSNLYLATQMNKIVEGANILTRNLIIFGQGVLRCHPYLRDLIYASSSDLTAFHKIFYRHLRFSMKAFFRGLWQGLTGGHWIKTPRHPCVKQLRQLSRVSNILVVLTEFSFLKLGRQLKRREALSARLGDILSYLYLSASVLKRFQDAEQVEDEISLVQWNLLYCLYRIQEAVEQFLANFPSPGIAKLLRWVLFPWGLRYAYPRDVLSSALAARIQQDLLWRERLTAACYVGEESDVVHQMDEVLAAILNNQSDVGSLRSAVVQVDEFVR